MSYTFESQTGQAYYERCRYFKGKPRKTDLPLLKNDIIRIFNPTK